VSLVVRDYDEAIEFYTKKLEFVLIEDIVLDAEKRGVVVAPSLKSSGFLLAKASNEVQKQAIGNQSGGRVFLFLEVDNFWEKYHKMIQSGIVFLEEPRQESYGLVVVFKDLYGNKWDLLQRS
jgi:catechol 2,3-dioxygenase-like lactoylglutathione lyase family enzyme